MDSRTLIRYSKSLFLCFLAFRLLNALLVETFHVADEYWQSLEVAHRAVYGYGFLTWEWQPTATLRSFLHPGIFASLYSVLNMFGLDEKWPVLLEVAPKLLQALIASFGDICLHYFAVEHYGPSMAVWFSLTNMTNWFLLHNLTRTLANSIETTLFSVFLCFWPVFGPSQWSITTHEDEELMIRRRRLALVCAGFCFLLRPTSAVTWAFFAIVHFYEHKRRISFLVEASLISMTVLGIGVAIDAAYYGGFVSPLWSFVRFNFLSSGAAHYGSHPWHWYLSNGIPMLLGPYIVPFAIGLLGVRSGGNQAQRLGGLILANVLAFSIIGHKEARFLMPLIPVFHVFAAQTLYKWWHRRKTHPLNRRFPHLTDVSTEPKSPSTVVKSEDRGLHRRRRSYQSHFSLSSNNSSNNVSNPINSGNVVTTSNIGNGPKVTLCDHLKWILACLLITASFVMAIYTCSVHQRGGVDLMRYVRNNPDVDQLLLLMPCHHTPAYAFVHRSDFVLDYLDCSPGLPEGKKDEADVFFDDPVFFLNERYDFFATEAYRTFVTNPFYKKDSGLGYETISTPAESRALPSHIAMYNVLGRNANVALWLKMHDYTLRKEFFHAHFEDGRSGTSVQLYTLDKPLD